jgi:hypothetical protein
MHLRYQTPLEARKALALNGKILSSSIMIGVIPCTDASLLASTTKNLPLASSVSVGNTSASFAVNSPKAGIRSLTQSYAVTPTDNQVRFSIPTLNVEFDFIAGSSVLRERCYNSYATLKFSYKFIFLEGLN